ncbi:MAG: AraC family transcriptional regulator [Eubacteriales bacterium]|nr:AraC family transcriptional regulator [Eubacteriales bacterium]
MGLPELSWERVALNWNEASSRLSPTPGSFTRENLVYVQETGYFETEPGYFTERQNLNSLLCILTVAGQGRLSYRGQNWSVTANSLLWIDCRDHHLYESCPDSTWKFFWVHFTGANSLAYYQTFNEQTNGGPLVRLESAEASSLADLFGTLIRQQSSHGLPSDLLSAQLLVELMTRAVLHDPGQFGALQNHHPAVTTAIHQMEEHVAGGLSLSDLAQVAKVSPYYLIKLFVRQTGLTPMAFWQQMRLSEAKRLLHQTDWTIERIADTVGLVPASHFIAVFRRVEAITPGQYRKRWLRGG